MPSSGSIRTKEVAMLEVLLLAVGVVLFCLLIAYERMTNRL